MQILTEELPKGGNAFPWELMSTLFREPAVCWVLAGSWGTNRNRTGCLKEPVIQEESQCVSKSCSAVRSSGTRSGTEEGILQLGGSGRRDTRAGLLEKAGY